MKLYKFSVSVAMDSDWEEFGVVLLPYPATREQAEHALAALGVYAPRGADSLESGHTFNSHPFMEIFDASGEPIVRPAARGF